MEKGEYMAKNFDFTVMDSLLDRAEREKDFELSNLISELILLSKRASDKGMSMQEIACLVTMGHFIAQEPELQSTLDFMLTKINPNDVFN
jgi:hypothetical protein